MQREANTLSGRFIGQLIYRRLFVLFGCFCAHLWRVYGSYFRVTSVASVGNCLAKGIFTGSLFTVYHVISYSFRS